MYGTQANAISNSKRRRFENDVKMYGTQADKMVIAREQAFENDVKMYGTQAFFAKYNTP